MSHKSILGLWLSLVLIGAAEGEAEIKGILGTSVRFQVNIPPPIQTISWSKVVGSNSEIIVVVTVGEPCSGLVPNPAYEKRVDISKDCRGLQLSHLKKEDAGRYTAESFPPNAEKKVVESFDLQIFRRLLDSEMRVACTPGGTRNGTWKLNCSTGTWEDGVDFIWSPDAQGKGPTPGSSVIIVQDLDLNVTCIATNPVSQASKTLSVKQLCAVRTVNFSRLPLWAVMCLSKLGSLLLLGCLGLILLFNSRKV